MEGEVPQLLTVEISVDVLVPLPSGRGSVKRPAGPGDRIMQHRNLKKQHAVSEWQSVRNRAVTGRERCPLVSSHRQINRSRNHEQYSSNGED
jgi:hypothetical protein